VKGQLKAVFEFVREQQIKNMTEPVRAFETLMGVRFFFRAE
jgi:hypothetical protein